ncbi:MAG: SsrA-binding protein SmpB [Bacteroidota bacterium]|nr:SsrA-binding protein SmpB [Bacteroidota bacterium]
MTLKPLNIFNKKANYEYFVDLKFTAGIVLKGTEVKSIREHNVNINDAYCMLEEGELWIKNMHISVFKQGSYNNHEPISNRKLLLSKQELKKITSRMKEKGVAIFPLKLYVNDRGFIKLDIGVGKGKKSFDKREDIKQKDIKRELSKIKF